MHHAQNAFVRVELPVASFVAALNCLLRQDVTFAHARKQTEPQPPAAPESSQPPVAKEHQPHAEARARLGRRGFSSRWHSRRRDRRQCTCRRAAEGEHARDAPQSPSLGGFGCLVGG